MYILILVIGFSIGFLLNFIIERISNKIAGRKKNFVTILPLMITSIVTIVSFEVSYWRFGFSLSFFKIIAMAALLIIVSFVDIRHHIINDFMILITLGLGILFAVITRVNFLDVILGMIVGGGVLFLLALIPNAMGGGDMKLMFSLGAFLGLKRILWAILLAFILSSIVSILLIVCKKKGTKDYIPFGPFLSLGGFISLLIL